MTYNCSSNSKLQSIKPKQHCHGVLNTTSSAPNTKPVESDSTGLDVSLTSCDGEDDVDSERLHASKSLFFPIPGMFVITGVQLRNRKLFKYLATIEVPLIFVNCLKYVQLGKIVYISPKGVIYSVYMYLQAVHICGWITWQNLSNTGMDVSSFKDDLSHTQNSDQDLSHHHSQSSSRPDHESSLPQIRHGKLVRLNGHELALFCYKDKFYAVNERCPHLGN